MNLWISVSGSDRARMYLKKDGVTKCKTPPLGSAESKESRDSRREVALSPFGRRAESAAATKLTRERRMIMRGKAPGRMKSIGDKVHHKPRARESIIFRSRYSKLIRATIAGAISRQKNNIFAFHPTETPKGFLNYICCEASIIFGRFRNT